VVDVEKYMCVECEVVVLATRENVAGFDLKSRSCGTAMTNHNPRISCISSLQGFERTSPEQAADCGLVRLERVTPPAMWFAADCRDMDVRSYVRVSVDNLVTL
jgi:hypothetical protein